MNTIFKCYYYLTGLILLLSIGINCNAQDSLFNKRYGGASNESINDFLQLPCDDYLVIGSSNSFSASSDLLLMRIN
ncbi:MAG: hypothetical protein IIA88_11695 [Bacteroidetes bacterium]|nr:hypothetical protein [Bacteroidota bacterium]